MKFVSLILMFFTLLTLRSSTVTAQTAARMDGLGEQSIDYSTSKYQESKSTQLPDIDAGEDILYLCNQDSVQLAATAGFMSYSWNPTLGLSDPTIANPFVGPFALTQGPITYTLTATDLDGVTSTDELFINIGPIVPTTAGADTLICSNDPVTLGAYPVSPAGSSFSWSPDEQIDDVNAEHPVVTPMSTTTYTVTSTNGTCTGSDLVTVIVEENNDIGFNFQTSPSCDGLIVTFTNKSAFSQNYTWQFGDESSSSEYSPVHTYPYSALYSISLSTTSDLGCIHQAYDILLASDFTSFFNVLLPNVITPNFDGENDVLDINIQGDIVNCISMQVFNRWGQVMFESTGNNTRWDGYSIAGELAPAGLYFYTLELNGTSYKGSVQVIY